MGANVSSLLDERWDTPPYGSVAMHKRQLYRKDVEGWVPTDLPSDKIIHKLQLAVGHGGLWRTDAAMHIGLRHVIDAVAHARQGR